MLRKSPVRHFLINSRLYKHCKTISWCFICDLRWVWRQTAALMIPLPAGDQEHDALLSRKPLRSKQQTSLLTAFLKETETWFQWIIAQRGDVIPPGSRRPVIWSNLRLRGNMTCQAVTLTLLLWFCSGRESGSGPAQLAARPAAAQQHHHVLDAAAQPQHPGPRLHHRLRRGKPLRRDGPSGQQAEILLHREPG